MKRANFATVAIIAIIIVSTVLVCIPLFTFAIPKDGDQCTTDYVGTLVGSDGGNFYRPGVQTSIRYYSDGSTGGFIHENYSGPRQHYLIMPDGETDYYGYCIQQGESFPDAQRYSGVGWTNNAYFSKLPATVRTGIMLATIFGWQPGLQVPVPGCNDDDWYWATQVIIWEYQQKLRFSPTILQGNGYVSSNYFQSTLAGRPAEKCYNYILESMEDYQQIPSFASTEASDVPINVLEWDSSKQLWSLTVNDINQTGYPLISDDSTITIEQKDSQYTFSSTIKFDLKTINIKKNVPMPSHELLIWGGSNRTQAISTGAADPINLFGRFRTQQPGAIEIVKTSEDKKKVGFTFKLVDQYGQSINLTTTEEGIARTELYPGEYMVSEEETDNYRMPQNQTIIIKENETTRLELMNILKKGQIQIQKTMNDSIANVVCAEAGAVFQIHSTEYEKYANTPTSLRDEITTDDQGLALTKELPLGNYIVHQILANRNVTRSKDIAIAIENDLQRVPIAIENQLQKGKILIFKTDNDNHPLAGAEFIIRSAEDIITPNGNLAYAKGSIIGSTISNVNGLASSDWLSPGNYEIQEMKAPSGYSLPINPVTIVSLTTDNQSSTTFFKQVSIKNSLVDVYPITGDEARRTSTKIILILMLTSLIGIGILAYMMNEQNKTLH